MRQWTPAAAGTVGATVCVLAVVLGGAAPALAAQPSGADRAAQVQSMLDRVLGPGNAVVEIADSRRSGGRSATTVSWGAATPRSVAVSDLRSAAASSTAIGQVNAVDRTTSTVATPAGSLVRQTVAVAVDRAATRTVPLARLRRLIAAAVGLSPRRGDRLVLVRTAFARQAPVRPARPSWLEQLLPLTPTAIEVAGGLVAALLLVVALRRRRRSA